jgi:hypothetical protein
LVAVLPIRNVFTRLFSEFSERINGSIDTAVRLHQTFKHNIVHRLYTL